MFWIYVTLFIIALTALLWDTGYFRGLVVNLTNGFIIWTVGFHWQYSEYNRASLSIGIQSTGDNQIRFYFEIFNLSFNFYVKLYTRSHVLYLLKLNEMYKEIINEENEKKN